jgi:hypothetical protein
VSKLYLASPAYRLGELKLSVMLQVVKSAYVQEMDENRASTEQSSHYHFDSPS